MKINDKLTQSVAEAVKEVIGHKIAEARMKELHGHIADGKSPEEIITAMKLKSSPDMIEFIKGLMETEVQDSDKDFVDLHSVDDKEDPEQKKYTEETEVEDEDEVEEGNEFTAAAAKAKLAGEDEFEFEGKTYPVEIKQDAAEKILGKSESADLEEGVAYVTNGKKTYMFNSTSRALDMYDSLGGSAKGWKVVTDPSKIKGTKVIKESVKWWTVTITKKAGKLFKGQTVDVKASNSAEAIKKGLKQMKVDNPMTVPSGSVDAVLAESLEEAAKPSNGKSTVDLEEAVSQADIKKILAAAKKAGGDIKGNQIDFGMGAVLDVSIEKGKIKLDGGKSNGVEYFKTAKDAVMTFESVDLEEAVTPADFVKGGDAKITKREVDGMLSKLFINTKLAKAVEASSAFKAGEKSNGKKNPYKKDTADFHLFILGQQSAGADS